MAKIALEKSEANRGSTVAHKICSGNGWSVANVVCTSGPADKPFEEQHRTVSIAFVAAGTFQYRTATGRELMTPGALLLGNAGDCFVCGHEHGVGDRCLAVSYSPECFASFAEEAEVGSTRFAVPRMPPIPALNATTARVPALLQLGDRAAWQEFCFELAANALRHASKVRRLRETDASSLARVTRVVRMLENAPDSAHTLAELAHTARLSHYHFLRVFSGVTGVTPHQFLLRQRLRRASDALLTSDTKIAQVAFDCGFGDVSNFNRAFRNEFGCSPRIFRHRHAVHALRVVKTAIL